MSVLIKNMEMPKGCIYANDNDQTEYCPLLNHDDVPFCRYIESEPEIAIGIDERPAYCPLSDVPDTNVGDTISRQAAIEAIKKNTFRLTVAEEQNAEGHVAWSADAVYSDVIEGELLELPSAQPERLTDYSFEESCTECPAYDTENHRCPRFNQVIRTVLKDANLEPCENCISRQAAIDALADMHCKSDEDGYVWIIRSDAWARIDALPSVTPKQKRGKWNAYYHGINETPSLN